MTTPHASAPRASAETLLDWYDRHGRDLPWRARPGARAEPYRVWLSEVMLQQTTVKAVMPYFARFTARWPDIAALAAADDAAVMAAWAGLGYYSRARKLLACAREISARGGSFPDTEEGLRALPGIGPYTAAAIAAIAFDKPATVVDGNVERVMTRLHAVESPLPRAKPEVVNLAAALTPSRRPGDYAQAVMDLGATICTPRKPACALCPWREPCRARARGDPESFPRKVVKAPRPLRRGAAFVVVRGGQDILLGRRPPRGLLGGMAEVPGTAWAVDFEPGRVDAAAPIPGLTWRTSVEPARHGFTHFELEVEVRVADAAADTPAPPGLWWHPIADLAAAGLPTVMRKIVEVAGFEVRSRLPDTSGG